MAIGVDHLDAYRLLFRAAQFQKRIDYAGAAAVLRAGKIAGCLLHKRDEDGMEWKIIGEIVESGSEEQHAALSNFLFQQHGHLIGQANRDASIAGIDANRKI